MTTKFSNLTFEEIKSNLKEFLKQQDEFTDYDFEGSAINILLDELAYFGQYVGFYSNLLYHEGNLTTATKRENVVRKAKEISYFPNQKRSSRAKLSLSIDLSNESLKPNSILIPRGINFVSEKQNGSFNFLTVDDYSLVDSTGNGVYSGEIDVYEGNLLNYNWTFNSELNQRFIIPNPNIDERFLNVYIDSVERKAKELWNYAKNIVGIDKDDKIYFLQEVEDRQIEIEFTNASNIGKDLVDGDGIEIDYIVSRGSESNGCKAFELIDDISSYSVDDFVVSTIEKSSGGSEEESKESIRQLAPVSYMAQNRAVNENDYRALIQSQFPFIQAINVWGGEENDPPRYGEVFISIKPNFGLFVGQNIKDDINEYLQNLKVVGVRPEIIDPEFVFINLDFDVFYDDRRTSKNTQAIKNDISTKIEEYFNENVVRFGDVLWQSHLTSFVDNIENYIVSSRYTIEIKREFTPTPNVTNNFTFKYANSIEPETFQSNVFGNGYQLKDDGEGNILLYQNDVLSKEDQGTIDYEEGTIDFQSFKPKISKNEIIELNATPKYRDVFSRKNFLLNLENININLKTI